MPDEDYNWLDDPWNEEKQRNDLRTAHQTGRLGCVGVGVIIAIVVSVLLVVPLLFVVWGLGSYS